MMSRQNHPAMPMSALDYLVIVGARQRATGGTAALAVPLEDNEQSILDGLLTEFASNGSSPRLEEQARQFLLVYVEREKLWRVLDPDERTQLNTIIASPRRDEPTLSAIRQSTHRRGLTVSRRAVVAVIAAVLTAPVCIGVVGLITQPGDPTPPAGSVQIHRPAREVPPVNTELQNLKSNFGPWEQLTPSEERPQTGDPALLLLEDSGYFASTQWTVAPQAAGWSFDIGGHVNKIDIQGDHAVITDSNGNQYVVGVDQPFIVTSDPGTVIRIDPIGTVNKMSLAQATAVRQQLK